MQFIKGIKDKFNALGTKEYKFENEGKTATVTTKNSLFSSSYTIAYNDGAGKSGEQKYFAMFKDVTAQGVHKAKDFCGITG